jgi:hypothetical protein
MVGILWTLACAGDKGDTAGGVEADADTDADSDTDTDSDTDSDSDTDTPGPDADEDGYGAAVDCDDTDAAVNPGAAETCGNGVDDNCNGTPDGCDWSGVTEIEGTELYDMEPGATAAREIAVCDLNADDQLDVLLGAPAAALPFTDSGAVYAFFGPITADDHTEATNWTLAGGINGARTGVSVECGDVDADGLDDVVVGAPGSGPTAGSVYLVPGGGVGSVPILDEVIGHWTGEYETDGLGADTAVLDLNGDGVTDFASVTQSGTPKAVTAAGAAYVWLGPTSGIASASVASARVYGEGADSVLGVVSTAGDLDGDGADELLVGGHDGPGFAFHSLLVFEGPMTGDTASGDADYRIGNDPFFGTASGGIAHADLDGDGFQDVVASNPTYDGNIGVSYVFYGDIVADTSASDADASIHGTAFGQMVGCAVVGPGDIDGDGNGELAVGACGDSTERVNAGAVFLFYGPFAGTLDVDAGARGGWRGDVAGGAAGTELAAGEVTGDRVLDLLVGVPGDVGGKAILVPSWNL